MVNLYKRLILTCSAIGMGALLLSSSIGQGPGYTPAPFDFQTCSSCHGGGSFGTTVSMQLLSGVTPVSTYIPGQAYTLRISIGGTSPAFGFEVTSAFQTSNTNISTWGTLPPGTSSVSGGGHTYIQHNTPLTGSQVDIPWTGPTGSSNAAVFYVSANRVNMNFGTTGDQVATNNLVVPNGCATITVGPSSVPNGTVGTAYSQTITQSGASGTPTFSISAGTLPPGLSLNTTTGAITGTPTTTGTYSFTVTVTGSNSCTGSTSYNNVVISCPTSSVSPGTLSGMTVGTSVNQTFTQTGLPGTITWSSTGTLPPGVTLNTTTGVLSGTPTTTGNYTFTITATGNGPCSASQTFTNLSVVCPTITVSPSTIPTFVVGTSVNQTYSQTGASGTVTWSATGLPPGVTLNPTTGLLSGTPTTTGTFNIVITATGNGPCSGSQTFNGTPVTCPTITLSPGTMPTMTVGSAFSQAMSQTGGSGTISWMISAGTLPAGLSLNTTTGLISGTPTSQGSYCFTVTATGNGPCSGSTQYCGSVNCPAATVSPGTLSNVIVGNTYSQNFTQTGLTGTITWSATGLPPGLSINSTTGQVTGTPNTTGTYTFTITATSNSGCTASNTYTISVNCATFVITPGTMPNVVVGGTYNQTISQTGNFGTISYTVTAGSLPPGLTLNSTTGAITGTANTQGTYTFTVTIANQYGCSTTQQYTINVTCVTGTLSPGTLPNLPIGQTYSQNMTITGGSGTYTYAVSTGTLPTGLTLSTAGVLSGTPTAAGSYTFTITATNQFGCTISTSYTIVVACPTISLNPGTLPPGNVGFAYSQTITVTGSTNTFTFTSTGTLPPGVTLNTTTGVLSGTPTTAGTYTFTITATDSYGCTTNTQYTVVISPCTPLVVSPGTIPNGTVNTAYSQTFTQTGGTGTITWSSSGTLPPGVTLNPTTGVLSGNPTATGTYTFTIIATDQTTCSGTMQYTITISCPTITLSPGTLPTDTTGQAYNQTITQTGSTGSVLTYTVSSGTLPPGLTLSSGGAITGTATTVGTYTFDVTMTDEYGCSATTTYTIVVVCPVITIDQSSLPTIFTNTPYNETLTNTGGTSPFTYTVSSGTLPPGISLATNGNLTGTTTAYGTHTVTFTVTDANGCTATQTITFTVDWPVSVKNVVAGKESIALLPNLVTDRTVAQIISNYDGQAKISITDITGKEVYKQNVSLKAGENKLTLDLHDLASGTYTFHVRPLNVKPVKFTKQ